MVWMVSVSLLDGWGMSICYSPWQKWTEEWAASDVVNHSLIVDPSVAPPGFDLRRCLWSTLARVDVQPASSTGISLQIRPVPVTHLHKLCRTLWTIVQILNFLEVCQPYIWLMRRLLPGSACRAYAKKKKNPWYSNCLPSTSTNCFFWIVFFRQARGQRRSPGRSDTCQTWCDSPE